MSLGHSLLKDSNGGRFTKSGLKSLAICGVLFLSWLLIGCSQAPTGRLVVLDLKLELVGAPVLGSASATPQGQAAANITVWEGRILCVPGKRSSCNLGPFNLRVTATPVGDDRALLDMELTPPVHGGQMRLASLNAEWGKTLTVADLVGKTKAKYSLQVTPRRADDATVASFVEADSLWQMDETVHFRIHFIPGSSGDYDWNYIGSFLELVDRLSKQQRGFYYSDKMNVYLHPKPAGDINWFRNENFAVLPTDNDIHFVDNRELQTVRTRAALLLSVYKLWGYAPDFISRGIASYLENPHFRAKRVLEADPGFRLGDLYRPAYRWDDYESNLAVSASFARYLYDTFGRNSFQQLFSTMTYANIEESMQEAFGKPVEDLWKEYREFIKGYAPIKRDIGQYAEMLFNLHRFAETLPYHTYLYDQDTTDIQITWMLGTSYYSLGEYDSALTYYKRLPMMDAARTDYYYLRGNAYYMVGNVDSAESSYSQLLQMDSTYAPAYFRRGNLEFQQGRLKEAERDFMMALGYTSEEEVLPDKFLAWARAWHSLGDGERADSLAQLAVVFGERLVESRPDVARFYSLLAEALIAVGEYERADSVLAIAENLERRPYYIGKNLLLRGNLADARDDRPGAVQYYKSVLDTKCGYPTKAWAEFYLKRAYTPISGGAATDAGTS